MATTFPATATKATLTGSSTGALITLTKIGLSGAERGAIDTSSMDTTTYKTFVPDDIVDGGEYNFEGLYDGSDLDAVITTASETWTLIWNSGGTGSSIATGFLTSFECDGEMGDVWKYSGTIKITGGNVIQNA